MEDEYTCSLMVLEQMDSDRHQVILDTDLTHFTKINSK